MARNPRSVHQFRAMRWLDEFFGVDDVDERRRRYDLALERLGADDFDLTGPTVARVEERAKQADGVPDPLEHLSRHWLSGEYWPSIGRERVRDELRDGYRDAITEAREQGLPLNSIWVCATDDPKAGVFRVDHVVGPSAVTIAVITPMPAGRT